MRLTAIMVSVVIMLVIVGQTSNSQTNNSAVEPQPPTVSFNSGKGRSLSNKNRVVSQKNPTIVIDVSNELHSIGLINFPLKKVAQVERYIFIRSDESGSAQRLFIVQFESVLPGIKGGYSFPMTNAMGLTRAELERGGSRASEREKVFAEFAARARRSFKVMDGKS
jgi:hypothetical protein